MRHEWTKKPRGQRLAEMVQVEERKIHGCGTRGPQEEAEPRLREDIEIRGVYSHSPGNGSSGGIRLGGFITSDVGEAVKLEELWGVKIPYYGANPANFDNFSFDSEAFVVGEMRQDARDKWACCTSQDRLAW